MPCCEWCYLLYILKYFVVNAILWTPESNAVVIFWLCYCYFYVFRRPLETPGVAPATEAILIVSQHILTQSIGIDYWGKWRESITIYVAKHLKHVCLGYEWGWHDFESWNFLLTAFPKPNIKILIRNFPDRVQGVYLHHPWCQGWPWPSCLPSGTLNVLRVPPFLTPYSWHTSINNINTKLNQTPEPIIARPSLLLISWSSYNIICKQITEGSG